MKQYIFLFFTVLLPTALFGDLTFENVTPYPVEITYMIIHSTSDGAVTGYLAAAHVQTVSVPAYDHIFITGENLLKEVQKITPRYWGTKHIGIELVEVAIMKDGRKEKIDFTKYRHIKHLDGVFLIIPWQGSYRLVRLIQ